MRRIAAKQEDKITLPAIVLVGGNWNINDINFYSLMHGSEFKRVENETLAKDINIIPITPSYDMYVMATSSRECDMLSREIIFHYLMNPTLTINIPYGINHLHTFNIEFGRNITKQSRQTGLVIRTINFTLQGAYLWHNNTFNINKETDVEVNKEYDKYV